MQLEELAVRDFLLPQKGGWFALVSGNGNGAKFNGLISKAPPFDPNTELGADPREKSILELYCGTSAITMNCRLREMKTGQLWQVIHRDANRADFATVFVVVQVVPGKDT